MRLHGSDASQGAAASRLDSLFAAIVHVTSFCARAGGANMDSAKSRQIALRRTRPRAQVAELPQHCSTTPSWAMLLVMKMPRESQLATHPKERGHGDRPPPVLGWTSIVFFFSGRRQSLLSVVFFVRRSRSDSLFRVLFGSHVLRQWCEFAWAICSLGDAARTRQKFRVVLEVGAALEADDVRHGHQFEVGVLVGYGGPHTGSDGLMPVGLCRSGFWTRVAKLLETCFLQRCSGNFDAPVAAGLRPKFTDFGRTLTDIGRCWPALVEFGQIWPMPTNFGHYGPTSVRVRPTSARFGRMAPSGAWNMPEHRLRKPDSSNFAARAERPERRRPI